MPPQARSISALLSAVVALGLLAGIHGHAQSDTPDLQLRRGQSLYTDGEYADALKAFVQASNTEIPVLRVSARIGVLQSALRVAKFELAKSTAVLLHDEQPRDAAILALFGDAMWSAGLFAEAEGAYADAASITPDLARAHNGLARTLCARIRYAEALDHALTAVRLAPQEADFYYTLGWTYQRLGRYQEATAAIDRFIRLLPKRDKDDRSRWAKTTIELLRSYGRAVPNETISSADAVYVLPFRLSNDKIVVSGRINRGDTMEFVVDTGAEMATVTRRTAERQGVTAITPTISAGVGEVGIRGLQIGRFNELELGDLTMRNVPCMIKTPALQDLPTPERESISPLALGYSITVDYERRQITLARHLPADPTPADEAMPLWLTRLATIRGMVGDGHARSFVVDTGGQVISISTDTANALHPAPGVSHIALRVYGASGWDRDAYLLPGVNLAFNDLRFNHLSVVVLTLRAPSVLLGYELGGIVGHQFLSRYRVSLDLEKAEMRLRKVL